MPSFHWSAWQVIDKKQNKFTDLRFKKASSGCFTCHLNCSCLMDCLTCSSDSQVRKQNIPFLSTLCVWEIKLWNCIRGFDLTWFADFIFAGSCCKVHSAAWNIQLQLICIWFDQYFLFLFFMLVSLTLVNLDHIFFNLFWYLLDYTFTVYRQALVWKVTAFYQSNVATEMWHVN